MKRSVWGLAVECVGVPPMLCGGIVAGVWSAINGNGFEQGADEAANAIASAVDKVADYADTHDDEINGFLKGIAFAVVTNVASKYLGEKADPVVRRYLT